MGSSVRKMAGFEKKNDNSSRTVDNVHDYVKDLNKFYCRFACHDFPYEQSNACSFLSSSVKPAICIIEFDEDCVKISLCSVNPNTGPDS